MVCQAQPLLVPEEVELSPTEVEFLLSKQVDLAAIGFDIQKQSDQTVEVKSVPSILAGRNLVDMVMALVQSDHGLDKESYAHYTLSTLACHSAIRAGEVLPDDDLKLLLSDAQKVDFLS